MRLLSRAAAVEAARGSRRFLLAALTVVTVAASLAAQEPAPATWPPPPPSPPREFRGVWVATVDNIDWPSRKGLPVARQRAELEAILDRALALRLNAVLLQVRPSCDAFYPSRLEPWSEWLTGTQGKPPEPEWDPLQAAIDGAHARGLQLHAWFNPYRARHEKAESRPAASHVTRKRPEIVVAHGKQLWLDPGEPQAQALTLAVVFDVVERYDVDGVHLDDYFYPYPIRGVAFDDTATWRRHGRDLPHAAWRRRNVDELVERLHRGIRARKPWVLFGISPFGIARPGVPAGIEAGLDQYADLAADVRKWLAEGWCDYLAPQLYWPIAQRPQSYATLLRWWPTQNPLRRHLWPGNNASRTMAANGWPVGEILEQVRLTRQQPGAGGNIHFSMRALMRDDGVGGALARGPYAAPALVPASPWLGDAKLPAPRLDVLGAPEDRMLQWAEVEGARGFTLQRFARGAWRYDGLLPPERRALRLAAEPADTDAIAIAALDRFGNLGPPAVHVLRAAAAATDAARQCEGRGR